MKIEIKPLSVNQAFQGKRFKTPKYKQWIEEAFYKLPNKIRIPKGKIYLRIKFGFSSKASDIDNPLKTIIDVLQFKYKFNDKMIYKLDVEKEIVGKGKEFIIFELNDYKND